MRKCILALGLFVCPAIFAQTYTPTANVAMLTSADGGATWESAGVPLDGSPNYVPTVYAAALCQSAPGQPWQLCSFSGGGGGAVNEVHNTDGTLTISPITGNVLASLNLAHPNTWTALQTFNANIYTPEIDITNAGTPVGGVNYTGGAVTLFGSSVGVLGNTVNLAGTTGGVHIQDAGLTVEHSNGTTGSVQLQYYPNEPCLGTDSSGNLQTCSGSGSSITLENVYASPGSFTFAHNLNSLYYQIHCITNLGSGTYGPATWTDYPVDANDASVTVPSSGDYICSFNAAGGLPSDFSVATSPTTLLYEPTMTGTQQPQFTVNQTATGGYSGTVTYSTSSLASGMTGSFSPTTITGSGSSTLTLSFPYSQTPASTTFSVSGTDGTKIHAASPTITVGTINQGLVECWAMNDGSGMTFADDCGTSNTQTLQAGTLTWASNAGLPGTTATFSSTAWTLGANQTATNFDGSSPFSISTWVKLADVSAYHSIAGDLQVSGNDQGWEVAYDAGGNGFGIFLINNISSNTEHIQVYCTTTYSANTLYNVIWTYDGSKTESGIHIYVNGTACAKTGTPTTLTDSIASTENVSLGARPNGTQPLNGLLAYTRIWNRELSSTDAANYYAAGAR